MFKTDFLANLLRRFNTSNKNSAIRKQVFEEESLQENGLSLEYGKLHERLIAALAENEKLAAVNRVQFHLLELESQNTWTNHVGRVILKGVASPFFLVVVPFKLYRLWRELKSQQAPKQLGGESFSAVLTAYADGGFAAVKSLLDSKPFSSAVKRKAYTVLSHHLGTIDPKCACQSACWAYEIDPHLFLRKWLAFQFYKAGNVLVADILLRTMLNDLGMTSVESNEEKQIHAAADEKYIAFVKSKLSDSNEEKEYNPCTTDNQLKLQFAKCLFSSLLIFSELIENKDRLTGKDTGAALKCKSVKYAVENNSSSIEKAVSEEESSSSEQLRIACVMDDFTFHCYAPECDLLQLHPEHWQMQLESFDADIFFIESAWKGLDSLWQHKISRVGSEILDVARWCRKQRIPIVFWSKEDPVHFGTFLPVASTADYVFTTDIDCIPKYKYYLGHDKVYLLPFGVQPHLHNPIEKYERKKAFNFAGSYYLKYPQRQKDFATLVDTLRGFYPVEIFDRNLDNPLSPDKFPQEYAAMVLGQLPYSEIDRAYKGYCFGININTSKQSQTMFARRVFELLASNTVVVSNFSRGMHLFFGDLVISSDNKMQLRNRLYDIYENATVYRKLRLLGLRKVMSEHRYTQRLAYLLSKVRGVGFSFPTKNILVVAAAESFEETQHILANYCRQAYHNKRLFLCVRQLKWINQDDATVVIFSDIESCFKAVLQEHSQVTFVSFMASRDYYGPMYLTDLILADAYSSAAAFGKGAYFEYSSDEYLLVNNGAQYRPVSQLIASASIVRANLLTETLLSSALSAADNAFLYFDDMFAIDEFNYCRGGMKGQVNLVHNTVDDLPMADQGVNLSQSIYPVAEKLQTAVSKQTKGLFSDLEPPEISGEDLFALLSKPKNKAVSTKLQDGKIQITSLLPSDKHVYFYITKSLGREECNFVFDNRLTLFCKADLDLRTVVEFQDEHGIKIGHSIDRVGYTAVLSIPHKCRKIRLGLRVQGRGEAAVSQLVFGGTDGQPALLLGCSSLLVIAKQYPTYNDLYKYGFLHSRIYGYKSYGILADMFRFRLKMADEDYFTEFEGVNIVTGDPILLDTTLSAGQYKCIVVHILDANMWTVLCKYVDRIKIIIWIHGAEIQPFSRRRFNSLIFDLEEVERQEIMGVQRLDFWRELLKNMHSNLHLVFVSQNLAREAMEDLDINIPAKRYSIIHNPIDTDLFEYIEKDQEQRKKILLLRPFVSRQYANDLAVDAINLLSEKEFFKDLEFRLIGDGKFFDETISPVSKFSNVTIEKGFLTRSQIASLHKHYGIFLCPTRWDSQGVSRDEAMSSGLVPITNNVGAVSEFVDEECGILVAPEDSTGLAQAIEKLYADSDLFYKLSHAAAMRVRRQSAAQSILPKELELIATFGLGNSEHDQPAFAVETHR